MAAAIGGEDDEVPEVEEYKELSDENSIQCIEMD